MDKVFYVLQSKSYFQPIWRDVDKKGKTEGMRLSDAKKLLEVYKEEERYLAEFNRKEFRIIKRTIFDEEIGE